MNQFKALCVVNLLAALQELDFVLANVLMALVADFMLVWLPAPTLSYRWQGATSLYHTTTLLVWLS